MNGQAGQAVAAVAEDVAGAAPVFSVRVPELRFSWTAVTKAVAIIWSTVAALYAGGVLYVPANKTDFDALKVIVETVKSVQAQQQAAQEAQQGAIQRLTQAVDNLSGIVAEIRDTSVRTVPIPVPVAPARQRR